MDLSNYIEVKDRLVMFYERFPEGSLDCDYDFVEISGQDFVVCNARAYRTPDDPNPSNGLAWEPIPGKTPYTRESELMNAQTSAWGRAIVALGISADKGIASANEVRNRQERAPTTPDPKEVQKLTKASKRKTLADVLTKTFNKDVDAIGAFVKEQTGKDSTKDLTIAQMDKLIAEVSK